MFNDPTEEQHFDQLSEKDRKAKMAAEAKSDGTEATKQEVDQLSEKDRKAKMAAEVESDGTEATKQNKEQLKSAMVSDEFKTKSETSGSCQKVGKKQATPPKAKRGHKRSPSMSQWTKHAYEQDFNVSPEMSEEAPANAMETMNTVIEEDPIEDDLTEGWSM